MGPCRSLCWCQACDAKEKRSGGRRRVWEFRALTSATCLHSTSDSVVVESDTGEDVSGSGFCQCNLLGRLFFFQGHSF